MIYSAIVGNSDLPRQGLPVFTEPLWFDNHRMGAKQYKVLAHLWVGGTTVYVDGNIFPQASEQDILKEFLPEGAELGLFAHPYRTSAWDEATLIRASKQDDEKRLTEFMLFYGDRLKESVLYEGGVLARRDSSVVRRFNEIWWSLICRWSHRDQLTLPLAVSLSGIKVHAVTPDVRNHPMFKLVPHPERDLPLVKAV